MKRLGEYRKTHEPGLVIIAPFVDIAPARRHPRDPPPGRPPGRHHQGQRRRHRQRHDLHPGRRRPAGAVQHRQLRRRHRRPRPDGAALGDRHDDARRGALGTGADQHRRPAADGGRHRQVGHPHQPDRDRRDRPAARRSSRRWPCRSRPTRRSGPRSCSPRASSSRPSTWPKARPRRRCGGPRASARPPSSRAEGAKQAAILESEGRAQAIATVYAAIKGAEPDPTLVAILQLDALSKFAESDNAKIVVPYESAALLGAAQTLRNVLAAASTNGSEPAAPPLAARPRP